MGWKSPWKTTFWEKMFYMFQAKKQIQATLSPRIMVHVVQNMTLLWEENSPSRGVVFKRHGRKSLSNSKPHDKKQKGWRLGSWRVKRCYFFLKAFYFPTKRGYFWFLLGTSDISSRTAKDLSRRLKSTMFNQGGFSCFWERIIWSEL